MKTKANKRSMIFRVSTLMIATVILVLGLCSCAVQKEADTSLSPALMTIAQENGMAKSALAGTPITFKAEDFERALNVSKIDNITISKTVPQTDGELRVGSTVIADGDTLNRSSIEMLTYTATSTVSSSEFSFRANGSPYEMTCKLYSLEKQNYAPTVSSVPQASLEVGTYKGVARSGRLECYDPDGDETFIEIVSYPKKGLLVMQSSVGDYKYIPYSDSTGKDSFVYVARDKYGNYSSAATVSLQIERRSRQTEFVDMSDSDSRYSALCMSDNGIMSGSSVGGAMYFYPENTVSRAEFIVMAMEAKGIREVSAATSLPFSDIGSLPERTKNYIATAHSLGYIKGSELDGELCFEPQRGISRAEACVILAEMLDAEVGTVKPVFDDADDIPTWAESSVYALCSLGVVSDEDGTIAPLEELTRADVADMLTVFMQITK